MLKKPISYFIIFALMHSSLAQVAYGMFPEEGYKHAPFVQPKAPQEQKQGDHNEEIPVSASKLISSSQNLVRESSIYTPSPSLADRIQPELPTSQPQAIVKQSNTVPANDPNSLELQSHSGSPTHIPGDSTPEKSASSSTTSTPEKSPRATIDVGEKAESPVLPSIISTVGPELKADLQEQTSQQPLEKGERENKVTNKSTTRDHKATSFLKTKPNENSPLLGPRTPSVQGKGDEENTLITSSNPSTELQEKPSLVSSVVDSILGLVKVKVSEKTTSTKALVTQPTSPLRNRPVNCIFSWD